ncbi:MAG: aminoacyl-tRNA hydrolase [Parcubacteria group bacterium]|nr:aminoacyl-tRNA hydrolase [Parcubacteria group bacterium]
MKLIVGLGNPGAEYECTRHNLGKRVIQASNDAVHWKRKDKFFAEIAEVKMGGQKVVLARLFTFMNESGKAMGALVKFYKIKPDDLLVVHDDSDIFFGKMKLSYGSRSAGHRGVESLIRTLGTKDFWRLRTGIRPPNEEIRKKAEKLILEKFTSVEEKKLGEEIFPRTIEAIKAWVNK